MKLRLSRGNIFSTPIIYCTLNDQRSFTQCGCASTETITSVLVQLRADIHDEQAALFFDVGDEIDLEKVSSDVRDSWLVKKISFCTPVTVDCRCCTFLGRWSMMKWYRGDRSDLLIEFLDI